MSALTLTFTIIQLISGLFLMVVVLMQSGKRSGLSGVIAGGMDTFMTKAKARTWDARLARITKWVALVFVLLTLALNLIFKATT
ncbi:MAG: preprotein translocase subunit SecG [Firmicutes bacterium]|nr:preprotein translocase subunit SecG [Bacillota bacterium]